MVVDVVVEVVVVVVVVRVVVVVVVVEVVGSPVVVVGPAVVVDFGPPSRHLNCKTLQACHNCQQSTYL